MNRRGFLAAILAAGAAPAIVRIGSLMPIKVLVPTTEEVLAVTGAIERGGNTLLTIDMITKEALRILNQNVTFMSAMNEQYKSEFNTLKKGDTLIVRTPRWYS